ncbi:MAG: RidA family protein [Patescibacteria group bacterium]
MKAPLSPFYKTGNMVFISGQVGSDSKTKVIPEDFQSQTENIFQNLRNVLELAGLTEVNVVKTTVFMTDLSLFPQMNELYADFFGKHLPARTTIGVAALPEFPGDPKVLIEIEAIAEISE